MMTWDVKEIIYWFRNLTNNIEPGWKEQRFLEQNISFYLLNNFDDEIKQINIQLDLEQFRKEFKPIPVNDDFKYSVIFKADRKELNRLADELQEEFDKYQVSSLFVIVTITLFGTPTKQRTFV